MIHNFFLFNIQASYQNMGYIQCDMNVVPAQVPCRQSYSQSQSLLSDKEDKMKPEAMNRSLDICLQLRKTSARKLSEGYTTSHCLKQNLFPPNAFNRIVQFINRNDGKKEKGVCLFIDLLNNSFFLLYNKYYYMHNCRGLKSFKNIS